MNPWEKTLECVKRKVSGNTYRAWFEPTKFLDVRHTTLYVSVPYAVFVQPLCRTYGAIVGSCLPEPYTFVEYCPKELDEPIKAWAVMLDDKIMEVYEHGKLEIYLSKEHAESHLEDFQGLVWVKGQPKVVPIEIRILPQ
jgi:hypothetical protein